MHPLVVNIKTDGCDVYVGRPSKWGNPFKSGVDGNRETVIYMYRVWLTARPQLMQEAVAELRGKTLGCHCAPKMCHADVLAEVANA